MNTIFETFRPQNKIISKYISYYYLDVKPNNTVLKFECFPHINTTISLYKSHYRTEDKKVIFQQNTDFLEIFTPIREEVLSVEQIGKVHRIVIVFTPMGIQQFYKNMDFSNFIFNQPFFSSTELAQLFQTEDILKLTHYLDEFLLKRYKSYSSPLVEKSIDLLLNNKEQIFIKNLASELDVSTKHLNRLFKRYFGIGVKKFYQILLFRKVLNKKLFINPELNFTEIAHDLFYNDQSHLIKTFQNLTLQSPKKMIKEGTVLGNEDTFWKIIE